MKEATGELSTTAIAIVAIGLILAIFTTILLPMIRTQITLNQACNSGPGYSGDHVCCTSINSGVGSSKTCNVPNGMTQKGSKTCEGAKVSGSTTTGTFTCYYYE